MKQTHALGTILAITAITAVLTACDDRILKDSFTVILPDHPPRHEMLGPPNWKLEWTNPQGKRESALTASGGDISVPAEWPTPILAWPYWNERGIAAGQLYPAGGLYPLDVRGGSLVLSWEGGAEAVFYRELEAAGETDNRQARYFDWRRFRTRLRTEAPAELRSDPWRADWALIARSTVKSGFRVSLLKAETLVSAAFNVPADGPWLAASPFRENAPWLKDEELDLACSPRGELFVSAQGLLFVKPGMTLWSPFP
jgi:hypothetical protein